MMKLISDLQRDPTLLLTLVIFLISICIIVFVIILLYRLESEKRVTRAMLELKKITNSIRAGLVHFIFEEEGRILYASKGFYDILGYDKTIVKSENKTTIFDFIASDHNEFVKNVELQLKQDTIKCEVQMLTKEGNRLNMLMNGNSTMGKDGRHTLSVVFVDISEQKEMQNLILLEGERYRVATELSKDILFEYHINLDQMVYTEKYRDMFGVSPVIQNYLTSCENRRDMVHPDDWGIYLELCQELPTGSSLIESQFRIKNILGEYIWCQIMGKTIYDDFKKPIRVIGKIVNVDSQKRELEALEYRATRDPLTGVYNKEVTIKKIDKFISGNPGGIHMLMFVDFDDFKSINDTYGHLRGDRVLIYVISQIKEVFSDGEIIGRIGGDEFIVFAGNVSNIDEVIKKAEILKKELNTTYRFDDYAIDISGSIGIALFPETGNNCEQLMDHADKALYQAKELGKRDYKLYSSVSI